MTEKKQKIYGQLAILLCAFLWSTSGLFIKLIDSHPAVISGLRSFFAIFVLVALRRNTAMPKKILPLFLAGTFYAATMILFVFANKLTFSANAIVLQYAAPVWTCLLGWFFLKEKPHSENWLSVALVMIGMVLVFQSSLGTGSLTGDILAFISGIAFAANSVVLRFFKDENPGDIFICAHIICFAFSIPFIILYPPVLNGTNALSILFMGFIQIGAASAFFAYGIRHIRAVQAMLLSSIEPVLNPVWVLVVTGERPSFSIIIGGAVIISAVVFSSLAGHKREAKK